MKILKNFFNQAALFNRADIVRVINDYLLFLSKGLQIYQMSIRILEHAIDNNNLELVKYCCQNKCGLSLATIMRYCSNEDASLELIAELLKVNKNCVQFQLLLKYYHIYARAYIFNPTVIAFLRSTLTPL